MIAFTTGLDDVDADAVLEDLEDLRSEHEWAIQAFDARLIAGERHVASAVGHANRAFHRGNQVARERSVEILLYAAGRRQIDDALEMGIRSDSQRLVVVVDEGPPPHESNGEPSPPDAPVKQWIRESTDRERRGARRVRDSPHLRGKWAVAQGAPSRIAAFFDITEAERGATTAGLEALVCERVALLDVRK